MAPHSKPMAKPKSTAPSGVVKKQQQPQKAGEEFPVIPWKMLRFWYGIFLCACSACRERNYHNQKKAVLIKDGGVRVNYQFCKRCAEANIYMGNIYYNTWGKKPEEQVVEEEEVEDDDDE